MSALAKAPSRKVFLFPLRLGGSERKKMEHAIGRKAISLPIVVWGLQGYAGDCGAMKGIWSAGIPTPALAHPSDSNTKSPVNAVCPRAPLT